MSYFLDVIKQLLGGPRGIAAKGKGYSLHIGLNELDPQHYGAKFPLVACENDARHMAHLCDVKGFKTKTLLTRQATRTAVLANSQELARTATAGDIVVITNSSHGSQVEDYAHEEVDMMDETVCMYDGQIIDDELDLLWQQFEAGVRVLFVSDSCHSGTMVKMFEPNVPSLMLRENIRGLPLNAAYAVNKDHEGFYRGVKAAAQTQLPQPVTASVLAYGACQDNQVAMDGRVNGAFTGALLQTLDAYSKDNLGKVFTRVGHILAPSQTPSYMYYGPRLNSFESAPAFTI